MSIQLSMMESRFELGLIRQWKLALGLFAAIAAVLALVAVVISPIQHNSWQTAAGLTTLLVGGFAAYRLLKWWVGYEVVVWVKADGIIIQQVADGKEMAIPFARLSAYRHESSNGNQQLRLKLTDGHKLKLVTNDVFGTAGDFDGLVQAIEQATANLQNENAAVIVREPSFFEKPVSTVVLVVITALCVLLIGKIVRDDLPIKGNMISGVGAYLTYLAAWLAAAKRRNQAPPRP